MDTPVALIEELKTIIKREGLRNVLDAAAYAVKQLHEAGGCLYDYDGAEPMILDEFEAIQAHNNLLERDLF